ncbi:allatostatin-A receptor [Maniola hyperantus]|uniref:allatostatin-A receptor n=1 Tax=Aphantopus hyperantus TaxID=2795564 RepID=UPI00156939E5|nr:FMRFamide receptor-like [Maniola hyperantus]
MITNATLGRDPAAGTLADDDEQQFDMWVTEVVSTLYVYYTPLLVLLGCVGNLLSVFVFRSSKLRLQSTSQYLTALALSDTVFLLQLLVPWLSATRVSGLFHYVGFCQFFVYLSYVTSCASAWLVVAFTLERFVAVLYPLRCNSMCTVKRARLVVLFLTFTSLALNVPVLRFAAPRDGDCDIDREYLVQAERFNLADTVVSFTLPLALIIVLNACIMSGVCSVERARAATSGLAACPRSQQRVTRMLLFVSSVFVVLNLPAYTIRVLAYAYGRNADEIGGRWTALQQISVMFFHTNFGINFYLYCLSGQNFRRALIQSIPWFRNRAHRSAAVRRTTFHPARASSISSSYVSNCTEATTGAITRTDTSGARRRPEHFIKRWTFDNSRQRARFPPSTVVITSNVEAVEMRSLGI